jgi:predicted transcriptional regulator of viral defense system
MQYQTLRKIKSIYFSHIHVAETLSILPESAKVLCSRYVKNGLMVRIKKDIYVLAEKFENLRFDEQLRLANIIQVPSYISLNTALSYYGITTQIQQNYIESISLKRSDHRLVNSYEFTFRKIAHPLYKDFVKQDFVFIATPEKAMADAIYFVSMGRYAIDFSAIDFSAFDPEVITNILAYFPEKTKNIWKSLC